MFSGLLYCADCGHTLHLNRTKSWARDKDNYTCGTYKREKGQCTAHFIRAVVLGTTGVGKPAGSHFLCP